MNLSIRRLVLPLFLAPAFLLAACGSDKTPGLPEAAPEFAADVNPNSATTGGRSPLRAILARVA
jgi:hypothetical protein